MLIFNKYKESSYLNLNDIFNVSISIKKNSSEINYLFKYSKKLLRSLLLVHFYIYSLFPFCPLLFRGSARYFLKLSSNLLILSDTNCLDNYFRI